MNRPLWSRALYVALTLWMSLFMSESEWLVRCPSHGGSDAAASTSIAGSDAGRGAGAAHHSGAREHADGAHDTSSDTDGPAHTCSCPGPGCCPPAVAAIPQGDLPLAHVVAVHAAIAAATLERFAEPSDYLQPPATAPPTVGLAPLV